MTALVFKLNTLASTNLTKVKDISTGVLKSFDGVNTTAAAIYLKVYWYTPTAANPAPTVGTTVPDLTIQIPALGTTTGNENRDWASGLQKAGQLWIAVTTLPADNDATAVGAGAGLITLGYE